MSMAVEHNNTASPIPSTLVVFAIQLALSTVVVGFTGPQSWIRPAVLPVLCSCVYGVIIKAPEQMRIRWCGLVGGLAYLYFLQYVDVALLGRWSYETHVNGPVSKQGPRRVRDTTSKGFRSRLGWGWSTMLSFRHCNTPYEIRNVPPFKANDPTYVPSQWNFTARQAIVGMTCYIILDLLDLRPPPADVDKAFDRSQIPLFGRINEITGKQWKLRVFSTFGFALTFFCIVQGFYSVVAATTVGLGLSDVAGWRPIFGSLSDAYTLRNFWGKFWHQSLRQNITSPARWLSRDVLKLPHGSSMSRLAGLALAFLGSGVMHLAADVSSGASRGEIGIFQFFFTHVCGILVEDQVRALYRRHKTKSKEPLYLRILTRGFGYLWVVAFMVWTGPVWIYPSALKSARPGPGPSSLLPFSLIKAIRCQTESK